MNNISSLTSAQFKRAAEIQKQIEALNGQLASIQNGGDSTPAPKSESTQLVRKNKFSPAGLARLRAAQKARWAKVKASKQIGDAAKPDKKKRRKMSAAARAKIAAAQKVRWAKFNAGK